MTVQKSDHLGHDVLATMLQEVSGRIPVGSTRSHYKDPSSRYGIEGHVIDEATDTVSVLYRPQASQIIFCRLASVWEEEVEYADGSMGKRFVRVR